MREQRLTSWFPPGVNPVRVGVYLATVVPEETFYRHWNGVSWLTGGDSVEEAVREAADGIPTHRQQMHWRGLAEQPK